MSKNSPNEKKGMQAYAVLTALAFELVILVVFGIFLGRFLDQKIGMKGLATAAMIFLALAIWLVLLLRSLKKLEASSETKTKNSEAS